MASATPLTFESLGRPLLETTFVVLDLETTGLSPTSDRITEIGAVKVRGGEVLGELRTFVHPGRPIPAAVTAVTGIDDSMVRDAPTIAAVLPSVLGFLDSGVFVAHNAAFDLGFLRTAADRLGLGPLQPPVVDTARLARRLLHDEIRDARLATVARHLRARASPDHRALTDARVTVDVLHGLIERAGSFGATTLEDLQELTRSSSTTQFRRRDLVVDAPSAPGVYRFLDPRDEVLYVGKATDLRQRLRTYFGQDPRRRIADLVRETARVDWTLTPTVLEAEVLELRAIRHHQPRYNRRSRDRSAAVHVAMTDEPFPRLSIVQRPRASHRWSVGPLPTRRIAERLIDAITEVVPLRTCTGRLRVAQDHPACILKDLGRCGAPCDGSQSRDAYAEVVATTTAAIDDPGGVLAALRREMADHAASGRFERAAEQRSRLHAAARALQGQRERARLISCARLVAARATASSIEVAVLRHGRLETTARLGVSTGAWPSEAELLATATVSHDPPATDEPGPPDAEELGLVCAWLARPDVRVVAVDGRFASELAGGRALAETVEESRRVDRDRRRDQQALSGAKVARRRAN